MRRAPVDEAATRLVRDCQTGDRYVSRLGNRIDITIRSSASRSASEVSGEYVASTSTRDPRTSRIHSLSTCPATCWYRSPPPSPSQLTKSRCPLDGLTSEASPEQCHRDEQ